MKLRPSRSTVPKSLFLFSSISLIVVYAQSTTGLTGLPNLSTVSGAKGATTIAAASSSATAATATTSKATTAQVSISGSGSAAGTQTVPSLSTSAVAGLTGLPKLSNGYAIPTASVPPTANAPYMRASALPEGTVFIAVGAILGLVGASILAWNIVAAWVLRRSVKQAAAISAADKKVLFGTIAPTIYNYNDRGSKASLGGFGMGGRESSAHGPTIPSFAAGPMASAHSLFYSPTAGPAGTNGSSGSRPSSYLPAGYYAAGAAHAGDGPVRESIGLSTLLPQAQGYARPTSQFQPSPPDSPSHHPRDTSRRSHASNLGAGMYDRPSERLPNERVPSTALGDMFDGSNGERTTFHRSSRQG